MSLNGISHLPTREQRQIAKLNLAAEKRALDGNPRNSYVIEQLPTRYNGDTVVDNPNIGGLVYGRPWVNAESYDGAELITEAGLSLSTEDGLIITAE
jgi:hypothetical protein